MLLTASSPVMARNAGLVAHVLSGAERQTETDEQKTEVRRALTDMLAKPPAALRRQRYADYAGHAGAWPLTTLVRRYFVPARRVPAWTDAAFYRDVPTPSARAAIRSQLATLGPVP